MKVGLCSSHEYQNAVSYPMKLIEKKMNRLSGDWSPRFADALDKYGIEYGVVYIDRHDWVEQADKYDVLIWKPRYMGVESSQFFKEKIYFLQHVMKKRVYPNYETVWHFDSKVAQHYLLKYQNINTPNTFASFDYNDSIGMAKKANYPVVYKKSNGAASSAVRMVKSKKQLIRKINQKFVWVKAVNKLFKSNFDSFGYTYFQEFVKENPGDLRVNIIGHRYASGFWRQNRKNDFRASGSGRLDYGREIPPDVIKYCADISRKNKFDSMGYDILFRGDEFLVVEMSYGYTDRYLYNTNGYYSLDDSGEIESFTEGHFWPQELWVKWIIEDSGLID